MCPRLCAAHVLAYAGGQRRVGLELVRGEGGAAEGVPGAGGEVLQDHGALHHLTHVRASVTGGWVLLRWWGGWTHGMAAAWRQHGGSMAAAWRQHG
jgi:hypothetical protein